MLIFSIFFHPSRKITFLGGAEKRFLEFLRFLSLNVNGKVEIIILEPEPSLIFNNNHKVKKVVVSQPFKVKSRNLPLNYLGWIIWSLKATVFSIPIVFRVKPDLILAPNNTLPNILPAFLVKALFKKPLCVTVHHFDLYAEKSEKVNLSLKNFFKTYRNIGYSFFTSIYKALASTLAVKLLEKAEFFISVSNFTASKLRLLGISKDRILISGNGAYSKKNFEVYCGKEKRFDAVFVGRIALEKGIYDLLEAWKLIVSKFREAKLAVVGEGPELEKVKVKIEKLGLENNISVFGGVPDKQMKKIVCNSKIFVFPSRFEGWGIAVAEALASGLPVVCYEIPALKEVFGDCESVFFVSKFNSKSLAEKILEVLNSFDVEFFRRKSLDFAKKFDWKQVFSKDLQFLFDLKNKGIK